MEFAARNMINLKQVYYEQAQKGALKRYEEMKRDEDDVNKNIELVRSVK
jgi:hypothetical protein